jgi:hypothetical protein
MNKLRELAYRLDATTWVREVLGVEPQPWQAEFLRAPLGASILALTARQVGKTTAAAWAIARGMIFGPGSLSVIVCPAQRQSAEAVPHGPVLDGVDQRQPVLDPIAGHRRLQWHAAVERLFGS